jgi:hypothetical protein
MLIKRTLILTGALTVSAALVEPPKRQRHSAHPMLPRLSLVSVLAPGFRQIIADYYWLLTINQTGAAHSVEAHRVIADYAELAVGLDPRFLEVYRFTALATPVQVGRGEWRNVELSTKLLRDGLQVYPGNYKLLYLLAHNLLFYHQEYREAGRLLQRLSTYPEAPKHLAALATRVLAQGGDIELAIDFATSMRDSAQDDDTREHFERRILQLHQERVLQTVDAAVEGFRAKFARLPLGLEELVSTQLLSALPIDPAGGRIRIGTDGRSRSSAEWYRLEVYDEAGKEAAARAQGEKDAFVPQVMP